MKFFTKFERPDSPVVDFKDAPKLVAVEFLKESDINFLLARYKNTGSLYTADEMLKASRRPQFGDFTGIPDYQETLDKVNSALAMFQDLPLKIRQRFHDSPTELLAFLQDEHNRDEAIKLGLVDAPPPVDEPPPVVKNDAPPTSSTVANTKAE